MSAATERALTWAGTALLAASLFLPVGYGAEIFGVIYGWMLLFPLAFYCPVYVLPLLGLVVARRSRVAAAILHGLGFAGWVLPVAIGGFTIDAFLSDREIFAGGLLAGTLASGTLFVLQLSRAKR